MVTKQSSKLDWKDVPRPINAFTVRNATMRDLATGDIVRYYSANTKIVVVQKCVMEKGTFYRTQSAAQRGLDWAFEATALGLPNEIAPLAPAPEKDDGDFPENTSSTPKEQKQKDDTSEPPKSGEEARQRSFWGRLFRH